MAKNGKMVLVTVLSLVALALSGGALIRQISKEKTKELPSYSYTIGAVTDEGKIDAEDKTCITSDKLQVKDLVSIEIEEDAEVTVSVHWYDEEGTLLKTDAVTDGTPVAPEGAETFRIEIEPTDDDDGKVSAFEKSDYAKLVTVTLKK